MAFNGAGTFNRLYSWVTDKANGIKIIAQRVDDEMDGMAAGLSNAITRDGQSTITAPISFNNQRITGLGDAIDDGDALNRRVTFPSPLTVAANRSFVKADSGRSIRITGTNTQTLLPASTLGAGWRAVFENAGTGVVTVATSGSELIDGISTSKQLLSKQRALVSTDGAGLFVWIWLDNQPIVATRTVTSAVAAVDLLVPAGYDMFEVFVSGIQVAADASNLNVRFSFDGGTTYLADNNYTFQSFYGSGSGVAANAIAGTSFIPIAGALTSTAIGVATIHGLLEPGGANEYPRITMSGNRSTASNIENGVFAGFYASKTRINAIRFVGASSLFGGRFIIRGVKV